MQRAGLNYEFMELAIKEARKNLFHLDGGPFGACIVRKGKVLAVSRNTVLKGDSTAHAEINAIRIASRKLRSFDLSGSYIYSTNEPCPMCFSAIHWAKIDVIVYGTSIEDAKRLGFNELCIPSSKMKCLGKSRVKIYKRFFLSECKKLLKDWENLENRVLY